MRTIMNMIHIEAKIKKEWPSILWKIQLVLNSMVKKNKHCTQLQALIGIKTTTPLIQVALSMTSLKI